MARRKTSVKRLRVLIAPDKFKGTLTAAQAARSISQGWHKSRSHDELALAPISDGGDGFGPVLSQALRAKAVRVQTVDAARRPVRATWWWVEETKTAIIESANVIGLAMLPEGDFHPFVLDTFGLGRVISAAERKGARRAFIGIGGSATNDGGFGLARALGWRFFDKSESEILRWTDLGQLKTIAQPERKAFRGKLTVAVDVQNPLLGARGCSRIYGPQKGLRAADMKPAETALRRLAKVVETTIGSAVHKVSGSGAAGGLGFGLQAFANARVQSGFELVAAQLGLRKMIRNSDLVIAGEGSLDPSSMMGKGVGELLLTCADAGVPVIGLAGQVIRNRQATRLLAGAHGLADLVGSQRAIREPASSLRELARVTAADW